MNTDEPIPKGENGEGEGRGSNGRFAKGWRGGPGNPFAAKVARLRKALLAQAKTGDVAAVRELLSRCLGPAEALDMADVTGDAEGGDSGHCEGEHAARIEQRGGGSL